MKALLIFLMVLPVAHLSAQAPDFLTPNAEVGKFVRERLLYKHAGKLTTKWLTLPKLEVTTSSPTLKAFVESTFASMCQSAGLTEPGEGTYHVFLGTLQEFLKLDLVKRRRPTYQAGWWYYWMNGDKSFNETLVILTAKPGEDEEIIREGLFHYMRTAFGVKGELGPSKISGFDFGEEYRSKLSPLDKLLIAFNYQHVPPGTSGGELPKLLRLYWNK